MVSMLPYIAYMDPMGYAFTLLFMDLWLLFHELPSRLTILDTIMNPRTDWTISIPTS